MADAEECVYLIGAENFKQAAAAARGKLPGDRIAVRTYL
jgi:hypothetical protein